MKALIPMLSLGLFLMTSAGAVEPAKPLVTLTVKRQLLDSDHDMRGKQGSSKSKTITLRVEIVNATSSAVDSSELSGDVLVTRANGEKERVVKESLGTVKLPAMKPNEKLTLDLGKIKLSEIEWRNRKFEETLEEWKVVCKQGQNEIGQAVSAERYETLEQEIAPPAPKPAVPGGPERRKIRKIGD